MFWKRRNTGGMALCCLAALLLTLGLGLRTAADGAVGTTTSQTAASSTQPGSSFATESPTHSEDTTAPDTHPEDTTAPDATGVDSTSVTAQEVPTTAGQGRDHISPQTGRILRGTALACFLLGGVLACLAVLFLPAAGAGPGIGPDGALTGVGLFLLLFSQDPSSFSLLPLTWGELGRGLLFCWLPLAALLLGCRELRRWLRVRLSPDWSWIHRVWVRVAPGPGSYAAGLLATSLGTVLIAAVLALAPAWPVSGQALGGGAVLAASCLPALWCFARFCRGMDRLSRQIRDLSLGGEVPTAPGPFQSEREALAALQQRQAEAVEAAVKSERFKVDLIANVSHDLRTPLTAILGYAELLQSERLSPEGQSQLEKLTSRAGYMTGLVDSIFELTKVSSGAAPANMQSIDLIRLLEQTLGLYDDRLREANLSVRRHYCAEQLPLRTDGTRLHQVLANLLGNCAKYALPGTRIHLTVTEDEQTASVRLTNIAAYEMDFTPEEITQRFARGDKARSTPGSGLGLAIAQTYTASLGGEFTVGVDGDQFSATVRLPKTERNL